MPCSDCTTFHGMNPNLKSDTVKHGTKQKNNIDI